MMKKKYVRFLSIFLAVGLLVILLFNFGVNYWLQNNLSGYIKKNSHYNVAYQSLTVDIFTGDISATAITVENKNPGDANVIGLQGSVDTLSISRLGIYDALFNKKINSSHLILIKPSLVITLAKPVDDKTGKKRSPVLFRNLKIKEGNITVFRHTKQKFLAVKELHLNVEDIQMTEESVERKLPLVFDKYDIKGKNFYFRPDNTYAVTAKTITTEAGQMSIKDFAVTPLLSYRNFTRFRPDRKNLYDFKTAEMNFKDIALDDNKITLTQAHFDSPVFKIMTTNAKSVANKKDFNYEINMQNVLFKNAKITVLKPDGTPKMSTESATVNISKFIMDAETSKASVPFNYANFSVAGKQINFASDTQNIMIGSLDFTPKSANLRNISLRPTAQSSYKTVMDLNIQQIHLKIDELKLVENKLKLAVQNVSVNSVQGKINAANNPKTKKGNFSGILFPLTVKNLDIKNSNIIYDKGNAPMVLNNLTAKIQNIEMNAATVKNGVPFKTGNYSLATTNFNQRTKFYNLSASLLKFSNNSLSISNFAVKPTLSRAQFIRAIPAEKDLYDIDVKQLTMNGTWDLLSDAKYLNASQVSLNGVAANIFRSKIPKDDLSEKPLYSKLLRNVKFPIYIQNLDIKNSVLTYEEDTKKSDGPGKLMFTNFNMNAKNVNSNKMKGKPTQVPVSIQCSFMNASPMNIKWTFDTADLSDAFAISGNVSDLPASRVNPFIEPYLKIRATGLISDLLFNFKGNNTGLNGTLNMRHKDLKVAVLKEDGEKNKLLSAVANVFVRTDSGKYPESVPVDNVHRDRTKSFFNLFWKGMEEGLKKTLIGRNVEKTEKAVKGTVANTESALKQNKKEIQQTKKDVAEKVQDVKQKVREKGKGLKSLFKKKSE